MVRPVRGLALISVVSLVIAPSPAQSTDAPDWQTAAGGKMSFEVASVKPSKVPRIPTFPLDNRNAKPPGGRFSASFGLWTYIQFAFKLSPNQDESRAAMAQMPKELNSEFFDIEAQAQGNPTKDQMRLMMQSLLAERFKLAVHFESREASVFVLTLVKQGNAGPRLRPHSEGPPCPDSFSTPALVTIPKADDIFPPNCETAQMRTTQDGMRLEGSRNTTLALISDEMYSSGVLAGEVDRPVVDGTGLTGRFDLLLEYRPGASDQLRRPGAPNPDDPPPSSEGTPFLNAVREQLGLKLVRSRAPIRTLVIDHVERPSAN